MYTRHQQHATAGGCRKSEEPQRHSPAIYMKRYAPHGVLSTLFGIRAEHMAAICRHIYMFRADKSVGCHTQPPRMTETNKTHPRLWVKSNRMKVLFTYNVCAIPRSAILGEPQILAVAYISNLITPENNISTAPGSNTWYMLYVLYLWQVQSTIDLAPSRPQLRTHGKWFNRRDERPDRI